MRLQTTICLFNEILLLDIPGPLMPNIRKPVTLKSKFTSFVFAIMEKIASRHNNKIYDVTFVLVFRNY